METPSQLINVPLTLRLGILPRFGSFRTLRRFPGERDYPRRILRTQSVAGKDIKIIPRMINSRGSLSRLP